MRKLISIVIPAYNERDNIKALVARLQGVFAANPRYDFEAIVVENGSADDSMELLLAARKEDPRFKIVQLARNFRFDGGLTAGLNYARGDAAVLMVADLQDPPELITEFIGKWEEGYENVYGIVTRRTGTSFLRRLNSQLFYLLANRLTNGMMPRNASDFRLADRRVYQVINRMEERNRFVRGLFPWVGFRSIGIPHVRPPRTAGVSGAHTLKVLGLALKGILAHSYVPLKAVGVLGLAMAAAGLAAAAAVLARALFLGGALLDRAGLAAGLLLSTGLVTLCLGVIAEYLCLIYEEVKQRPNYVVARTEGFDDAQAAR